MASAHAKTLLSAVNPKARAGLEADGELGAVVESMLERARAAWPAIGVSEAAFLRSLRSNRYHVEAPTEADLLRAAALVDQYGNLPLGGTDASIVALAERLDEVDIATLDRRHFTVVRPEHVEHFTLLPEPLQST